MNAHQRMALKLVRKMREAQDVKAGRATPKKRRTSPKNSPEAAIAALRARGVRVVETTNNRTITATSTKS